MTPEELRAAIPALDETVYLNTGASGPSPHRVIEAAQRELERHEDDAHAHDDPYKFAFDRFDETRAAVADFVGAVPDEIALTNSTTDGINVVASAIDWESGDVIVRPDFEHAGGILPWKRFQREHGVEIRVVETAGGRIPSDAYTEAVADARLVVFSAITWTHGTRLPVAELVEIAHDAGAEVLVDAVQVPGQTPLDVSEWGAEFVAAAGHKWLLGPWGAGFLYVEESAANDLEPAAVGYRSVEDSYASQPTYKPGARRFEVGTASPGPYAGLREAIDVVESIGIDTIESRIRELTAYLKEELGEDRLLSPREFESGLVTIRAEDPEATVERLAASGVVVRALPIPNTIRASVHAFNTRDDLDALLAELDRQ